jgi:hypothetical protein
MLLCNLFGIVIATAINANKISEIAEDSEDPEEEVKGTQHCRETK